MSSAWVPAAESGSRDEVPESDIAMAAIAMETRQLRPIQWTRTRFPYPDPSWPCQALSHLCFCEVTRCPRDHGETLWLEFLQVYPWVPGNTLYSPNCSFPRLAFPRRLHPIAWTSKAQFKPKPRTPHPEVASIKSVTRGMFRTGLNTTLGKICPPPASEPRCMYVSMC